MPASASGVSTVGEQVCLQGQSGDAVYAIWVTATPANRLKKYGYARLIRPISASVLLEVDGRTIWGGGVYVFPRGGAPIHQIRVVWEEAGIPWSASSSTSY